MRFFSEYGKRCRLRFHTLIAAQLNAQAPYFDCVIQFGALQNDPKFIFDALKCDKKFFTHDLDELKSLTRGDIRALIILNGNLNYSFQIQELLQTLESVINRHSRLAIVSYNGYLQKVFSVAQFLGIRKDQSTLTFLTRQNFDNLAKVCNFDVVYHKPILYSVFGIPGVDSLLNKLMPIIPIFRWLGLSCTTVLRPCSKKLLGPSLSIIIPARNEKGNIDSAVARLLPDFAGFSEIIFVEGHSTDGTQAEIDSVTEKYGKQISIKSFAQTGVGKADAVRLGFKHAKHDILTILDADLTMPPEDLYKFYKAYCDGHADFINGSRLLYPMEVGAMRFLNRLGNLFFIRIIGILLGIQISDALCGTKLLARRDYERFVKWRNDFGDFDPFGDFELIFPAAILGLGIIEIPVRYRARTYGSTQIHRFRHGLILLHMCWVGFRKVALGKVE